MLMSQHEECAGWLNGSLDTYRDPLYGNVGSGGFTSQARQDSLLWQHIFSQLQRPGVYIDVAANHYKRISNTFFYDSCARWRGVCVEPNPVYHDELRAKRTCDLIPTCASDSSRPVNIALPTNPVHGLLGGVDGGLTHSRPHAARAHWNITITTAAERNEVQLRCVVLGEELRRRKMTHIDFMSLDVEGHESAVLDGIDFAYTRIDYILCEATRVCAIKLKPHGFSQIQLPGLKGDTVWRHPNAQEAALRASDGSGAWIGKSIAHALRVGYQSLVRGLRAVGAMSTRPAVPQRSLSASTAGLESCIVSRGFPCLGFGTAGAGAEAIEMALQAGFRLIDTAVFYRREKEVAMGIKAAGVTRSSLTIVSKAWPFNQSVKSGSVDASVGLCSPREMVERLEAHISAMGVGYLNAVLLHWPPAPRALPEFWLALSKVHQRGLVREIGLSNVGVAHLKQLALAGLPQPAIVQTDLAAVRADLRIPDELEALDGYSHEHGIRLMSHSSVKGLFKDKRARKMAGSLNVTVPQLGLRYGLQRGFTMLFGSRRHSHMVDNLGALRFNLNADEMRQIASWRCSKSQIGKSSVVSRCTRSDRTGSHRRRKRAAAMEWLPLVGKDAEDIYAQHPDPLRALSTGQIPAIVIQARLGERVRRAVVDRLHNEAAHLWSLVNNSHGQSTYGCLGRQINRHIQASTGGAAEYARLAQLDVQRMHDHGLWEPVHTLYASLSAIASGRSVGPARDLATNTSYSPAAYRFTKNGGGFPPHVDSMHAGALRGRRCLKSVTKSAALGQSERYPDAFRFGTQFSALILLQAGGEVGNRTSSALTLHDLHLDDLGTDCMLDVRPTAWNCPVTFCPGCRSAERSHRFGNWRQHSLVVREGDVYLFNANQVHEIRAVHGPVKRITLGAFVGYSREELRVWI